MRPTQFAAAAGIAMSAAVAAAPLHAQTTTKTDIPPALAKQAKISLDSARAIATRRVPNATIASQELENEHGRLIYSFDMKIAGKSGIEEVNVNAKTGAVVAVAHESPKSEAKEAKQEAAEQKKP